MKKVSAIVVYSYLYDYEKERFKYNIYSLSIRKNNMGRVLIIDNPDRFTFDSFYDMVKFILKICKQNGYYISLISDDFQSKLYDIDFIEHGTSYCPQMRYVRDMV